MITVAAPTRVWQRLAAAPDGPRPVVHAGATALYLDLDGGPAGCLGLVAAPASRVPCALWSRLPDLTALNGLPVRVAGGTLVVGDQPVRVGRLVDVRLPRPEPRRRRRRPATCPDLPDLPADGHLTPADVNRLVGRGPGLTPLGDDVLAGWLAVRAAAAAPDEAVGDAVRRSLPRTTSLSATLLDCALHGEALPELAAWVTARGTPAEDQAEDALLAVGASSGAGILAGARLALRSLGANATPATSHPGRVA